MRFPDFSFPQFGRIEKSRTVQREVKGTLEKNRAEADAPENNIFPETGDRLRSRRGEVRKEEEKSVK